MELSGTREFHAPRSVVWSVIVDPATLAGLMPGVSNFALIDGRSWRATVRVPVGVGSLTMKVEFERVDERPPEFATLRANGKGVGATMRMMTSFNLVGDTARTSLQWHADIQVGGPAASMGTRVLQALFGRQIDLLLQALEQQVSTGALLPSSTVRPCG